MNKNQFALIVLDDNQHTELHFQKVLKAIFKYEDKLIRSICQVINREKSAECIVGPMERIEFYQETLARYGINSKIEVRI